MGNHRIIFTVTNHLHTDQRMQRICHSLQDAGFNVLLIGRRQSGEPATIDLPFANHRICCRFQRGKLFYIEYNLKLLLLLLSRPADVICSIDLDTLLPGVIASKLKGSKLGYDAHEYFTEMEEIVTRPIIHRLWKWVARFCIPQAQFGYTISEGYANLFSEQYGVAMKVIRNVPLTRAISPNVASEQSNIIIYQGALNVGRGIEQAMEAMGQIPDMRLHIYGEGPERERLEALRAQISWKDRIQFFGAVLPDQLKEITPKAFVGLTLFSATGIHHRLSLANRFFDYLHAEIPQLAMDFQEYQEVNAQHEIAVLLKDLDSECIVNGIQQLRKDRELYHKMKANTKALKSDLCWELESKKLIEIYRGI